MKANKDFLQKISEYYKLKGNIPTSYKIARKEAFLETSNLNSAFQRMAQEPKSKQKKIDKIYELLVLNHTFLVSLASVSTYIQQHKTSEASEQFKIATEKIEKNLVSVLQCLKDKSCNESRVSFENDSFFKEQLPKFNSLDSKHMASKDEQTERNLQEAHLVWEQLQWLFSISDTMLKLATSIKLD